MSARCSGPAPFCKASRRELIESSSTSIRASRSRASEKGAEIADGWDASAPRVVTSPGGGVVLAVDLTGLVLLAARQDCVIEMVPQVGEFVAPGEPVFRIHGGAAFAAETLRQSIALGAERTIEQDPALAFRVIVDIASKGLSPAINDPTTAVLAIDQIHHLLRHIGKRGASITPICAMASGRVRVVYRTPDWFRQARRHGDSPVQRRHQVVRRLHTYTDDDPGGSRTVAKGPLEEELVILDRVVQRMFTEPEEDKNSWREPTILKESEGRPSFEEEAKFDRRKGASDMTA